MLLVRQISAKSKGVGYENPLFCAISRGMTHISFELSVLCGGGVMPSETNMEKWSNCANEERAAQ